MSLRLYLLEAAKKVIKKDDKKKKTVDYEKGNPADIARSHRLIHREFGLWSKTKTGPIVASTKDGKFKWMADEKSIENDKKKENIKNTDKINKQKASTQTTKLSQELQKTKIELEKTKENLKKEKTKKANFIAGKDKTINKSINTISEPYFKESLYDPIKPDKTFEKKCKDYKGRDLNVKYKWNTPSFFYSDSKMPQRESQILNRLMNLKKYDSTKPPISFVADDGKDSGAGQLSAQAGELMALAFTSCETKAKAEELKKSIEDHLTKNKESNKDMVIDKSWLKAAWGQSETILRHIKVVKKTDDPRSLIEHGCWDTKAGVESLGMEYSQKGFSTDIFFKLKDKKDEKSILEVSLKKDEKIFFLNSGTGKFQDWYGEGNKVPDNINIGVYQKKQTELLTKTMTPENIKRAKSLLMQNNEKDKDTIKQIMAEIDNDPKNLDSFLKNKSNRKTRKVSLYCAELLANNGDKKSIKSYDEIKSLSDKYATDSIKAVCIDKRLKEGMMKDISAEFPIKACADGEEVMAIGSLNLNKPVTKAIFGTDNWEEIKEDLVAVTDKKPPYIAYKAKGKGEYIPIANVMVREDGKGYGSSFKFELSLNGDFYKLLRSKNEEIYGSLKERNDNFKDFMYSDFIMESEDD